MLVGLATILGARQFWIVAGNFVDFKIFILFFVLFFFK
jgi:hypothetical protein